MRLSILAVTVAAVIFVPAGSEAGKMREPGEGFLEHKHPKVQKNYYLVHRGESDKCSVVSGRWGNAPAGALGGAPYVSKDYAIAALKKFPQCKGGVVEGELDDKTPGKE